MLGPDTLTNLRGALLVIVLSFSLAMVACASLGVSVEGLSSTPAWAPQSMLLMCWSGWLIGWWNVLRAWSRIIDERSLRLEFAGKGILVTQAFGVVVAGLLMVVSMGSRSVLDAVDSGILWAAFVSLFALLVATFVLGWAWLRTLATRCEETEAAECASKLLGLGAALAGESIFLLLAAVGDMEVMGIILLVTGLTFVTLWIMWNHFLFTLRVAVSVERFCARSPEPIGVSE